MAVGNGQAAERLLVPLRRPGGDVIAVAGREREAPRRAGRERSCGRHLDEAARHRLEVERGDLGRAGLARASCAGRRSSTTFPAPLPAPPGLAGFTRRPVRRSSTISGTAAARHATTASRRPSPRRRQARSPPGRSAGRSSAPATYCTASSCRETSRGTSRCPRGRGSACMARKRADSGPAPTMRTRTSGIRSRSTAAARSRSSSRLRGYMRATASTVGGPRRRRLDGREAAAPLGEIDRLRHHGQTLRAARRRPSWATARRVAAGHHDAGPPDPCCVAPSAPG